MKNGFRLSAGVVLACFVGGGGVATFPSAAAQSVQVAQAEEVPAYKPPLRGAPGGRVGGASRGGASSAALPTIEPLAPDAHSGLTANASPTLYFFVSRPSPSPLRLTISVPNQPRPIIETSLPAGGAGIQPIRLADYRVQLQPGIPYQWSVSVTVDPRAPSNDVVASATIMRAAPDAALDNAARAAP